MVSGFLESELRRGCEVEFFQVDVFADGPYMGNQLAVFPDAGELTARQMQAIASEMNLSETTFVTSHSSDSYEVRIFTPANEMPFAGHPTIGTAWLLRNEKIIKGDRIVQKGQSGETVVDFDGDITWMEREGFTEKDLEADDHAALDLVAKALDIGRRDVGMEARELGRSGFLRPAIADAGLRQLMVPVRDVSALERCRVPVGLDHLAMGVYPFTAIGAGRVRARGLWPGVGVSEDPATGSAAAALGVYLADRVGDIEMEVFQGQEIGRPSLMFVRGTKGRARVGGQCVLMFVGELQELPR
jgi:trans-2,3-dihydro-3-hydroxyanthranilate isomerase